MKRNLFSEPDAFSQHPMLALLPVRGDVARLASLTGALFARYERVSALRRDTAGDLNAEPRKRMAAEEAMLRQILDWLNVRPESGGVQHE